MKQISWFHYLRHSAILNTYWYSAKGSKWALCRFHKHFCLCLHCFWYSPLKFLAPSAFPMYSLHFLNSERVQGFIWVLTICILIQKLPLGKKLGLTSGVFFLYLSRTTVLCCLWSNVQKQLFTYFVQFSSYLWWKMSLDPVSLSRPGIEVVQFIFSMLYKAIK